MVGDVKYRKNLDAKCFESWKDVPETQMYWLAVLMREGGTFTLRLQWEGLQPDRGVEHLLHYKECEGCQHTAASKGGYAVFLFCNSRFVYGFDLRSASILPHEKEYTQYLRSLIDAKF